MKERTAAVIGFLVAPVVPALALGLFTPITDGKPDFVSVLGLFPIGYFFAVVASTLFGLPAFFLLRRLKLIRWWSAAATGFFIGICIGIALQRPDVPNLPFETWITEAIRSSLAMAAAGGLAAIVFWLIWSKGRPQAGL